MRVQRIYNSFTDVVDIGRIGLFIEMDKKGPFHTMDDVVEQAKHFNLLVITGDDPFEQREEVASVVKKYKKNNPFGHIQIITNGMFRPVKLNSQNDVKYIVEVKLSNSGIPFDKRVDERVLSWFKDANSAFVFEVESEDDFDEVSLIVSSVEIRKTQVFIIPKGDVEKICMLAKVKKYNITFKVGNTIWGEPDDKEGGVTETY